MDSEAKAMKAGKHDQEHWRNIYLVHEAQFMDALDIKLKLELIKFLETQSSNQTANKVVNENE